MKGKLIVLEGTDASGKRTQFELLTKKIKKEKYKLITFDFPRYDSYYGKIIARYLNGQLGDLDKVDPYFISLAYAFDRLEMRDKIKKALKQGKIIICNRYVASNKAHQSARLEKKEKFIDWLDNLEYKINRMPRPNLTIFLHVPYKISSKLASEERKRKYTKKKKDLHEKDKDYMKRVETIYLRLSKNKNWKKINCIKNNNILSKEEIHEKVWKAVKKVIV